MTIQTSIGVGMLTVPFGAEPADSVLSFVEAAVAAGHVIDVQSATLSGLHSHRTV